MSEIPVTFDAEQDCWIAHAPSYIGEVGLKAIAQHAYKQQMQRLKAAPASATAEARRNFIERADKLILKPIKLNIMAQGFDLFKSTHGTGKIISLGAQQHG